MKTSTLIRALMSDLVNDYRAFLSHQKLESATRCMADIKTLFSSRHTTRLDRYGWPACLPK